MDEDDVEGSEDDRAAGGSERPRVDRPPAEGSPHGLPLMLPRRCCNVRGVVAFRRYDGGYGLLT